MTFWRRLFGSDPSAPVPEPAPAQPEPAPGGDAILLDLRRLGEPEGPSPAAALALLRQAQSSPREHAVLQALLPALAERPAVELDPLRAACATLLAARGEEAGALRLVEGCRSTEALMVAAELCALQGDFARAVGLLERVLARDVDVPGARERHERWCERLGRRAKPAPPDAGATVVAPLRQGFALRLLREVARGGAGTVYEAEDELLGRRVAFKIYHRLGASRDQILREARLAAHLRGPGVLPVLDADPGAGWLVTEWIARGSLRDVLRLGGGAELRPLCRWVPPLVRALARVHEAGLVHADLKPANVLFRSPDDPLLGDFGICRPTGAAGDGGTPGYLPPERLAGEPAAPWDDVYALGRIIEDALAASAPAAGPGVDVTGDRDASYHELAAACLAPAAHRPADGRAVLELLGAG
ncbi:MAG: serine/threonine protein kinase [Deltaproteobacteria bacterium]|nr:serine/threonine protein kinase [Deltaproteobacteria bacterium]